MWNQNGRTPYITYEYTVLRDSLPPVPPPPVYTGLDTSAGEVSVEVDGLLSPNSSIYGQTATGDHLQPGGAEGQKGQETNEVYEEAAAIDCDQDGATASKYSGGDCWNPSDQFMETEHYQGFISSTVNLLKYEIVCIIAQISFWFITANTK